MNIRKIIRGASVVVVLAAGLALGACANNPAADANASAGAAAAPGSQQDFVVNVGDRVFFESDQSDLTAQGRATLDKQVQWLGRYAQYTFTVEGHADERGTREYNIALGARRAAVVVNFLVSKGVNPQRITSKSFGKERPVAICNDISCWSQNRRAVTVVQ